MMSATKSRLPSLSALSAIGGAALQNGKEGGPTLLPLDKIEEDANQPRTHFDAKEMEELAASIRMRGMLQPIGVVKGDIDSYRIVFGARRYRAARMAALQVIPAIILSADQATLDVQMIENIHRTDLRGSELVAGIARMGKEGKSRKEIAELLGWDADRVKRCQALDEAPPFILKVLDGGTTMRAVYDLFYAWKKAPAAIETAIGDATEFSYDQVRAIIAVALEKTAPVSKKAGEVSAAPSLPEGAPSPSTAQIEPPSGEEQHEPARADNAHEADPPAAEDELGERGRPAPLAGAAPAAETAREPSRQAASAARRSPRFTVAAGDRQGLLVTNRLSDSQNHALVDFDGAIEDVALDALRFIAVTAHP